MTGSREDLPGSFILRLNLQPYAARGSDKSTRAGSSHTRGEVRAGAASGGRGGGGGGGGNSSLGFFSSSTHHREADGFYSSLLFSPHFRPIPTRKPGRVRPAEARVTCKETEYWSRASSASCCLWPNAHPLADGNLPLGRCRELPPPSPPSRPSPKTKQNKCIPPKPVSSVVS